MADVIRKATNKFGKGLVMDFSPENTRNEVLTHALNATLLTFNGNELSLLNDMGNARVETAYLPEGYMPVGTCEYGGIIYIVSYNPLEDKSQIGCFPSPERNISSDELGIENAKITKSYFQNFDSEGNPDSEGIILHNTLYVLLKNDKLNPGDKFIVCSNKEIYNEKLADLWVDKDDKYYAGKVNPYDFELVKNPIIALNVVSIEESGKIVYLNSDIRLYEVSDSYTKDGQQYEDIYKYHILGKMPEGANQLAKDDIDVYRNVLSSGYSVFKSKTSGKLAILAELIMIDSYSVTHSVVPRTNELNNTVEGTFDVIIHTEVTPEITTENYNIVPKLQFYYLENSLGYILVAPNVFGNSTVPLFYVDNEGYNTGNYNGPFFSTSLKNIYVPTVDSDELKLDKTLGNSGSFNFPKPYTYHGRMNPYDGNVSGTADTSIYTKFIEGDYHRINYSLISSNLDYYTDLILAKFYYYDPSGESYTKYEQDEIVETYTYYIREDDHIYTDVQRNTAYLGKDLYKMVTIPIEATTDVVNDITVEKFQTLEIHTYKKATNEDIESGEKLYYTEDGGTTYVTETGSPIEGREYYILKVEENYVSIGYVVESDVVSGTIYYLPETKTYDTPTQEELDMYWDFDTYPYSSTAPYGSPITLYWREEQYTYKEATLEQITYHKELGVELFYSTNYIYVDRIDLYNRSNQLFIVVPIDTFVDSTKFIPNTNYNWINSKTKPYGEYPKDDPIFLYTLSDFIPDNEDKSDGNYLGYNDLKLANITLPSVVSLNGLDLPFKYDYTIVPCMNYGKLQHLAVSNTVDFSKLHAFNQSTFNTWKYRIDENLLRLTFGAEIYDTYETYKVDGLVLEFYDCWGFAGSIEITDKKSYSGIFTKIIPLNSLQAISKKKIVSNGYIETFKRNINITEKRDSEGLVVENSYIFNDLEVKFENYSDGWNISLEDNDCGTLYSNIVYGVKAYLRRTTNSGKEFIKKKEFFLYTLPIYNDYYYAVNDFSNLTYPQLDLMLTYKIKDNSTRTPYVLDGIVNGYNETDKANVTSYLGGFYDLTQLDLTRYYKYEGASELYLEVGLKSEYLDLNISYDPEINKIFKCDLKLISDDDANKTFTINSGVDGITDNTQILNYLNSDVLLQEDSITNLNKLGFGTGYSSNTILEDSAFKETNFINYIGQLPLKIHYSFVVGYNASINNIRNTQVQATTVCALFHKKPTGEYNYEDFGVYEQYDESGETREDGTIVTQLLSDIMFYNEGTAEKEVFGLCKLVSTKGSTMIDLLSDITSVETEAKDIKTAGKLNSGEPLKQLVSHIGKLTFCQPHAHGFSEVNGVNIHDWDNTKNYGIAPYVSVNTSHGSGSDPKGIIPTDYLFKYPKYNMCVNTKNSIAYNSEFISTLEYDDSFKGTVYECQNSTETGVGALKVNNVQMRKYTGLTGTLIATFNEKMLKTMSSVYAYNPDYDSLTVNIGDITLLDYNPYYTSNLLSINSDLNYLENQSFNDFIYLGPINFSRYLMHLRDFSETSKGNEALNVGTETSFTDDGVTVTTIKAIPLLSLIPGLDYCGTPENQYLISTLTYNTPVPKDLESELEFSASNLTVIKHTDGENTFLNGVPNKKTLYGYHKLYDKMVLLDVTNYTIAADGTLTLKDEAARETSEGYLTITSDINLNLSNTHIFNHSFVNKDGVTVELKLRFGLEMYGSNTQFSLLQTGENGFFTGLMLRIGYSGQGFIMRPKITIVSSNNALNYNYSINVNSVELELKSRVLNDKVSLYDYPIPLYRQSYDALSTLISDFQQEVTLVNSNGQNVTELNVTYWATMYDFYDTLYANGSWIDSSNNNEIVLDTNGSIKFSYENNASTGNYEYLIGLTEFVLNKINFTVIQTSKLETTPESFLSTTRTNKYYSKQNHKYVVDEAYKDTRLRGSSITINDLLYEPNATGHRLYMRNNLYTYDKNLRGKLYYRIIADRYDSSWNYESTLYMNNIFIFTGPCYTLDNLNYNSAIDG